MVNESLRVIESEANRLTAMVEDLLTRPDCSRANRSQNRS